MLDAATFPDSTGAAHRFQWSDKRCAGWPDLGREQRSARPRICPLASFSPFDRDRAAGGFRAVSCKPTLRRGPTANVIDCFDKPSPFGGNE